MLPSKLVPKCALRDRSVLLSVSIPTTDAKEFERVPDAAIKIEEAVISIARAVFFEGGNLVFGGTPAFAPLITQVLEHYYVPTAADTSIRDRDQHEKRFADDESGAFDIRDHLQNWHNPSALIYCSNEWRKYLSHGIDRLGERSQVDVAPIDAHAMMKEKNLTAMITVGGMEDVMEEFNLFHELNQNAPIYVLETTGGAASNIAKQKREGEKKRQKPDKKGRDDGEPRRLAMDFKRVHISDDGALGLVNQFWSEQKHSEDIARQRHGDEEPKDRHDDDLNRERDHYVPYGFVAQQIVTEIIKRTGDDQRRERR